jgi:hypothetical protein
MTKDLSAKRFVIFVISVPLIFFAGLLGLSIFGKPIFESGEYPMWQFNKQYMTFSVGGKLNILVIGDSRMKAAYIPADKSALNLSLGGGSPIEGYYTLKGYLQHHDAPKYLILSYAPFHLMHTDSFWERTIKYRYLSLQDEQEVLTQAVRFNSALLARDKSRWLYHYSPQPHFPAIKNGLQKKRWKKYEPKLSELKESLGHSFFGIKGVEAGNQETEEQQYKESELLNYYLEKMLLLANTHKIPVFWYTAPFTQLSYDATTDDFKRGFSDYLDSFSSEMKVINHITELDNSLFGDDSHLYKGSKQVSFFVDEYVKSYLSRE